MTTDTDKLRQEIYEVTPETWLSVLDELDRLRAEVKVRRIEGWRVGTTQAAMQCTAVNVYPAESARHRCAQAIRALQPPAEWWE